MFDPRDLALPVVAAPMAGGASTPALAAAVAAAGGLGFLAAGYRTAAAVADDLVATRALTTGPIGLNLFLVRPSPVDAVAIEDYRRALAADAARLGVDLGEPRFDDDGWDAKVALALDLRPDLVSFTFDCPDAVVLGHFRDVGVHTAVTVTTLAEATAAVARGAASLAVQGPDAGGHRGTWDAGAEPATTPLRDLVARIVSAVDVPVVAGGGLSDPARVRAVLAAGAAAVQVGTAYLRADEAGTHAVHREALTTFGGTELTRAWTGRWARGLANRFQAAHRDAPAGYPQLHHLTAPLRRAAATAGDPQTLHLWAGTGYASVQELPAAEITRRLVG